MREESGRAFMAGFIRVMMDQFVQGLAGSQRGHEQNHPDQQARKQRLAELTQIWPLTLQSNAN